MQISDSQNYQQDDYFRKHFSILFPNNMKEISLIRGSIFRDNDGLCDMVLM